MMVVSTFVEFFSVGFCGCLKDLPVSRNVHKSFVDPYWDILQNFRRMITQTVDILRFVIGLHEGLMDAILHVHGDVQEVNYLLVGSDGDGKIEIPEHLADFLLQNFVLSGCFV